MPASAGRCASRATSRATSPLAITVGREHDGWRLIDVVAEWLPGAAGRPLSRAAVRRLILSGAVRADGRRAPPGSPVGAGARVEVRLPPEERRPATPEVGPDAILYDDGAVLAVSKPPGLPMHATADPSRPHLVALVKALLAGRRGADPREVYLGVHQRLDRDTSGLVLFATNAGANAGLAAAFEGRAVEKTYLALTARPARLPAARWTVALALAPGRERVRATAGGQPARTDFRRREVHPAGLLVEARPRTGRKHQVRAHLAASDAPVLGDRVYAPPAVARRAPRVMLHAWRLALAHPVTGAPLLLEDTPPGDFARLLERLREG